MISITAGFHDILIETTIPFLSEHLKSTLFFCYRTTPLARSKQSTGASGQIQSFRPSNGSPLTSCAFVRPTEMRQFDFEAVNDSLAKENAA
jgi:hypothetical protein